MVKRKDTKVSGELLVADYQSAFLAVATTQYANSEAERSESNLMNQLSYLSRGGYLNPGNLEESQQSDISRASIDAHFKKLQAKQLSNMSLNQLQALIEDDNALYKGKKAEIVVRDTGSKPVDAVWYNERTGYRSNTITKKKFIGTIEEVVLEKNLLILKPQLFPRLVNREFRAYFVYIVSPETAQPMVSVTLL